jgi:DNA-binding transcriptional LysR family regulator
MDWDKLRIFQAVADAGSFTHAGEGLKLSQSAISRQIGALEEQLGVMLFHRHARGLILTEQGELLYRTARDMAAKVNTAEALLRANQDKPAGRLKVTTTVGFGSTWLTAQMHEFIEMYPEIDVSLVLSDNELDLGMREADVAIRMVMPRQPGLIQRHLLTVRSHVYAGHTYIQKYGKPRTVEDLDKHRLIIFGEDARAPVQDVNWLLKEGNPEESEDNRTVVLRVNNVYGIFRAVESDRLAARLPGPRVDQARNGPARPQCPYNGCVLHLSRGAAPFQAHRGFPRFPAAKGDRGTILGGCSALQHRREACSHRMPVLRHWP